MKKNLNIIDYIIENKKLNQGAIGSALGISQAQISKWKSGDKIPNNRELELIELAELKDSCDEFKLFDTKTADSSWAILTMKYCDGNDWIEYLTTLIYKNQIHSIRENDILAGDELTSWIKNFLLMLNDADVELPRAPEQANSKNTDFYVPDETGFITLNPILKKIELILTNISNLQDRIIIKSSQELIENKYFNKIFDLIPNACLYKILLGEEQKNGPVGLGPLITDWFGSYSFQADHLKKIDLLIKSYKDKVGHLNDEFDWKDLSVDMCGSEYILLREESAQRRKIKEEAKDIIATSELADEVKATSKNFEKTNSSSIESLDIDKDLEKNFSLAERMITEQLNSNRKLMEELHVKIDLLIDQNGKNNSMPS